MYACHELAANVAWLGPIILDCCVQFERYSLNAVLSAAMNTELCSYSLLYGTFTQNHCIFAAIAMGRPKLSGTQYLELTRINTYD